MILHTLLAPLARTVIRWRQRAEARQPASPATLGQLRQRLAVFLPAPLTIELVPATSWGANLRSVLPKEDWDRLRKSTCRATGYRCEICRERGPAHPVECHERWKYDDAAGVQRLVGLVALCPSCYAVKHLGAEALVKLMRLNNWTAAVAREYVDLVFEIWEMRSAVEWRLDLSWLTASPGARTRYPAPRARARGGRSLPGARVLR